MHDLSNNIRTTLNVAHENMTNAGQRMKRDFDKRSAERHLKVNNLALVLLPTSDRKLETRWFGPVSVKRVLPQNNYEVDLGHRKAIFHINALRRFNSDEQSDVNVRPTMTIIDDRSEDCMDGRQTGDGN